jgi:hypothetical protein
MKKAEGRKSCTTVPLSRSESGSGPQHLDPEFTDKVQMRPDPDHKMLKYDLIKKVQYRISCIRPEYLEKLQSFDVEIQKIVPAGAQLWKYSREKLRKCVNCYKPSFFKNNTKFNFN